MNDIEKVVVQIMSGDKDGAKEAISDILTQRAAEVIDSMRAGVAEGMLGESGEIKNKVVKTQGDYEHRVKTVNGNEYHAIFDKKGNHLHGGTQKYCENKMKELVGK